MLFQKSTNGASAAASPKFKLRRKHVKKVFVVALYSIVVVATIIGMAAPALQF